MSKWAVVESGGKQYKVAEGQTIIVEKLGTDEGDTIFDRVLLVVKDDGPVIGRPFIEKAKVQGKILGSFKDKKIKVVKFKSKSHYRKTQGHRQTKTKVLIEKIVS